MGERHFGYFTWIVSALGAPIPETASKSVDGDIAPVHPA
jgi:hypothetical protein